VSNNAELDTLLDRSFVFRERPAPAAADLRAVWRIPLTLMLTRACRGSQATHEQLHVLNWAVRSTESTERLGEFLAGKIRPEQAVVRFEPALDRTVALAHGFRLLTWRKKRYWALGEGASELLTAIDEDEQIFTVEKALLSSLPSQLSQAAVRRLLGREIR
jgi:hypothetical protein